MTTAAPEAEPVGRDAIETRITELKTKHDRMPKHWEARRSEQMAEVMKLVDQLLALDHPVR